MGPSKRKEATDTTLSSACTQFLVTPEWSDGRLTGKFRHSSIPSPDDDEESVTQQHSSMYVTV